MTKSEARSILEELVPTAPATKVLYLGTRPQLDELREESESAQKAEQNQAPNPALILPSII